MKLISDRVPVSVQPDELKNTKITMQCNVQYKSCQIGEHLFSQQTIASPRRSQKSSPEVNSHIISQVMEQAVHRPPSSGIQIILLLTCACLLYILGHIAYDFVDTSSTLKSNNFYINQWSYYEQKCKVTKKKKKMQFIVK